MGIQDRITRIDAYDNFGVRNMVRYRGSFEHPWFFDTDKHRLMEEYSENFVHLRSLKTGDIYQFRLSVLPAFCLPSILITSTSEVTFSVSLHKDGQASIAGTLARYAKAGVEKPSRTAYNGIVKFGGYIKEQGKRLQQECQLMDTEFTDNSLYLIGKYLRRMADEG